MSKPLMSILIFTFLIGCSESNSTSNHGKIMPLGDSITHGIPSNSGYRSHLWYKIVNAGDTADFVGSRNVGAEITPSFDTNNEGHPGWTSYEIAERIHGYMTQSQPNIVLLHIGTNDYSTSISGVNSILNQIDIYEQESGKTVKVFVATIIDKRDGFIIINGFNANLKRLVDSRKKDGDKLTLVDMYNNAGLTSADYADNTHPNDNGYKKMADVWFKAL